MVFKETWGYARAYPIRRVVAKAHLEDGVSSRAREIAARKIPLAWVVPGGNSRIGADVVKVVEMLPCRAPQRSITTWVATVSIRRVGGKGICSRTIR